MPKVPRYDKFTPASPVASRIKKANRKEGGAAEHMLRSLLWRRGLRYRVHVRDLPGKPDIVFPQARLCVFVDGDFWHGRDWAVLREKLSDRANSEYWIAKIGRNRERDLQQQEQLTKLGWTVVRFWETDVLSDPEWASSQIEDAVRRL